MAKKPRKLSDVDFDIANGLALEAIRSIGKSQFTVYATLDMDHPHTIDAFNTFCEVLLDAYKKGVASATGPINTDVM